VRVEEYAYYVNKLRQNIGLETWIWRKIVTSQTAHTKYKQPPYATEWNPPWKFSAYATDKGTSICQTVMSHFWELLYILWNPITKKFAKNERWLSFYRNMCSFSLELVKFQAKQNGTYRVCWKRLTGRTRFSGSER